MKTTLIAATTILVASLIGNVAAQDRRHPKDPCPKGTREVVVQKEKHWNATGKVIPPRVEIIGSGGQRTMETWKVCRPEKNVGK